MPNDMGKVGCSTIGGKNDTGEGRMTATIIDGKAIAAEVRSEVKADTAELVERGITPGLATVLVGDDPASHVYVRSKRKASTRASPRTRC